jgi:hypothetical protein
MSAPRQAEAFAFRTAAVERYQARRAVAAASLLRLPRAPLGPWLLAALLLTTLGAAWFARLPVYVSGVAVVMAPTAAPGEPSEVVVAALLPGESLASLRPGQTLYLQLGADGERLRRTVASVDPAVVSPDALPSHLGLGQLNRGVGMLLGGPVVVARARLEPLPPPLAPSAYLGSVVPVQVEVGQRRVIALLPLFDRLLQGAADES